MLLLPLRFKIKLHLYSSDSKNRPASDLADDQTNGVAPRVIYGIIWVTHATPGYSLDTPLPVLKDLTHEALLHYSNCCQLKRCDPFSLKAESDGGCSE